MSADPAQEAADRIREERRRAGTLGTPQSSVCECRGEAASETVQAPGGEPDPLPQVTQARPPASDVLDRRLARLLPIWKERYPS